MMKMSDYWGYLTDTAAENLSHFHTPVVFQLSSIEVDIAIRFGKYQCTVRVDNIGQYTASAISGTVLSNATHKTCHLGPSYIAQYHA